MKKILVTGATGNIGKQVAEQLLAAGERVRIAVRDPARGGDLVARGAEPVALDWDDPSTYDAAFAGVDGVFLLTPFVEDTIPYVARAIAAARAGGVEHIVRLSAIGADATNQHGRAEALIRDSGIGSTMLQPTFFADNPLVFQKETIDAQGAFYGASAGGRMSFVSTQDIAAVATEVLRHPEAHLGQSYLLTGGEALTDAELADILGEIKGRKVTYVNVPVEAYDASLRAQGAPGWMAEHLSMFETVKAQGWASQVSDAVQRVLGRPPTPIREALARYR